MSAICSDIIRDPVDRQRVKIEILRCRDDDYITGWVITDPAASVPSLKVMNVAVRENSLYKVKVPDHLLLEDGRLAVFYCEGHLLSGVVLYEQFVKYEAEISELQDMGIIQWFKPIDNGTFAHYDLMSGLPLSDTGGALDDGKLTSTQVLAITSGLVSVSALTMSVLRMDPRLLVTRLLDKVADKADFPILFDTITHIVKKGLEKWRIT